jgi:flagellar protein FlaG
MNVETMSSPGGALHAPPRPAEQIDFDRRKKESLNADSLASAENPKIQPEELLDQIKTLTEEGLYSVRFEKDDVMAETVVKIFDNKTQELLRQFPAEELLNFKATFAELVGNLVNTKG